MKKKQLLYLFLFLISASLTSALVYVLNTKLYTPIPLGSFFSPQHGFWQNAESVKKDFNEDIDISSLKGKVNVYLDDRMVPHVFAEHDEDAYFVQGYLHAANRLWQMDIQTRAAAGRVSEIIGKAGLKHDRTFRRLGMVYAAENALSQMEKDPETKAASDAYSAGINAYIESLTESTLPLEYKLLGYYPEKWNNLKSALFLKYMSFDLTGHENDFELTNAKSWFNKQEFDLLFPLRRDSTLPVIRNADSIPYAKISPQAPESVDTSYLRFNDTSSYVRVKATEEPNPENGSNNWALDSSRTASKYPILCNDPHLGLNLPSLWYEMQISTPTHNVYGVSFPGSPGIIIGFNDSCAFGFTNGGRDVKDYYEIKFKDRLRKQYWFNNNWKNANQRIETIHVAGEKDVLDTVSYTMFGPVMYDPSFAGDYAFNQKSYAVKWSAHDPSNELKLFYLLDRAKNYSDYVTACSFLKSPGQNIVFACKNGDIAMRTAGRFPAKWSGQGDFIMPGYDSSYLWQANIPDDEMPFEHNPERGFVSSANQQPVFNDYPYYLGRDYPSIRGYFLNQKLNELYNVTVDEMKQLQGNNTSLMAVYGKKILTGFLDTVNLTPYEKELFYQINQWDANFISQSEVATCYTLWWKNLYHTIYTDEYANAPKNTQWPWETVCMEAILKDSNYLFIDNAQTAKKETLRELVSIAFKQTCDTSLSIRKKGKLAWSAYQHTSIRHILKLPELSSLDVLANGDAYALNATTSDHGQSWRMIVHLTPQTEAYGIFPGGQSGNPGSIYYDRSVQDWAKQTYYKIWMMSESEKNNGKVRAIISFRNS